MSQIEDFGQKIGGARKDVWKLNGITANDFAEMNEMERSTYVKKDNVWIKPDWEQKIAEGTPQAVAYWQSKMRAALPAKPPKSTEEGQRNYIAAVSQIRDAVMSVKDQYDIQQFLSEFLRPNFASSVSSYSFYVKPEAEGIINNKLLKTAQMRYYRIEREAKEKLFGIPKDEQAYVSAKQDLKIYCYDKNNVTLDRDPYNSESTRLTIKESGGRSFYYFRPGSKFYDADNWQENTYFVMGEKIRTPLRINIPTREEAEKFVEEFARASQITADIDRNSKDKENTNSNRKKNFVPPQLSHI